MRYLVYTLVLFNLAYFAWHQYSTTDKPLYLQPVPLAPGIEPLVLLSERQNSKSSAAAVKVDKEQQAIESTATEPVPVIEYVAPTEAVAVQDANTSHESEHVCQTIGPLLDKNNAASISAQLYSQGYQPAVRGGEVREPSGYWVYMPAMPAGEARAIVNDLDANGMKDYFIGKRNHISLGIFSSKRKAQVRQKRIKTLGYNALLDQRYRTRTVFWLDVEEKGKPLLGSGFWDRIQVQYADIRVQRVSCE